MENQWESTRKMKWTQRRYTDSFCYPLFFNFEAGRVDGGSGQCETVVIPMYPFTRDLGSTLYGFVFVFVFVCMYVCMYACIYVCIYIYIYVLLPP